MIRKKLWLLSLTALIFFCLPSTGLQAQVTIAQISDSHIGLARSPHGSDQLRKVVQMVNQRNPDVVVVTGDIGERPSAWDEARGILKGLHAKVYFIPGNHDVHSTDVNRYRGAFGDDYYKFTVKNVTIYALDSQLLGNWDQFDAHSEPSMSQETRSEGDKMLQWLEAQAKGQPGDEDHGKDRDKNDRDKKDRDDHDKKGRDNDKGRRDMSGTGSIVLAMQHVPDERDNGFPNDPKPYWTVNGSYRQREEAALKKLGVRDMLVGHWHYGRVFDAAGFTWHVAPSTSWSPFGGKLGFALHTISSDGRVNTQFVYLDGSAD